MALPFRSALDYRPDGLTGALPAADGEPGLDPKAGAPQRRANTVPVLRVLEYSPDREAAFRPITPAAIAPLLSAADDAPLLWIDAPTPEPEELAALAEAFQWHPLIREDLEHGDQRQKAEQFPGHIFAVLRLPHSVKGTACDLYIVQSEHVIVTVHQVPSEWIDRLARDVAARGDLDKHRAAGAVASILAGVTDAYEETID
ncbi:MAG: CorA family divalent cation transporter, partial [Chloroflexota bacterium]